MGKPVIRQGPIEEYKVLAYCQDKQFANANRQVVFTCASVAKETNIPLAKVRAAVATLINESCFLEMEHKSKAGFILKGCHIKW